MPQATAGQTALLLIHYSADEIHRVNLVSLDGKFCRVHSTAAILDEIIYFPTGV
ncbi:MAG: hypothetical protein GY785_23055 [Gammaproteobacteria bacterium]|nr:hypothetical protein [Gammaproteobacteria bacterium]